MKVLTMETLRSFKPCYDPIRYLPENWSGTILDIVSIDEIPWEDRLWVVMRDNLVSDKLMRLFAVWCARQVQHLMDDERSLKALDVAEAFANGQASWGTLASAWSAAREDAWNDAGAAAWSAAWSDAGSAAGAAARDAWSAAREAARAAAGDAARYAWDAGEAARADQKDQAVLMILEGIDTGDVK